MDSDVVLAVVLFIYLLLFYWLNEPKARQQEQERRQRRRYHRLNRQRDPAARIVMTSFAAVQSATDSVQASATDVSLKPFSSDLPHGAAAAARAQKSVPPLSFFVNGYCFWPLVLLPGEMTIPQALKVRRVFQIEGPSGEQGCCIVGVTPQARELVYAATKRDYPNSDFLWDMLCENALSDYLLAKAELPPDILPIYELTSGQLLNIRRFSACAA